LGQAEGKDAKIAGLGATLFSSPALSKGRGTSCATCHDPAKGFTDGKPEALGEMQIATGRNTPTLFAIGLIARFRDPNQSLTAKPGRAPKTLTLEERCLEPLNNELEMGPGTDEIVAMLRKQPEFGKQFDEAFGDQGGVTKSRLAKALAAFVRTLDAKAPYAEHLAGNTSALSEPEKRGLEVFNQFGCATCHSGPALSDGMMHVVDPPWGQRMRDRQRTASERRIDLLKKHYAKNKTVSDVEQMSVEAMAKEARLRANSLPGGGGYDPDQIEVQTATLWDVKRTAPYFRDGSVKTLDEAVRVHLNEMKTVRENEARLKKELSALDKVGKRSPIPLRADPKIVDAPPAGGRDLSTQELKDLLEFLNSLSPR
jgi:cytochrome c peroxidase